MGQVRKDFPVLRYGRQYLRPVSFLGLPFSVYGGGELTAWSRILDDEEAVCAVNVHGTERRGADVLVDAALNPEGSSMRVVLNTAQVDSTGGSHPAGSSLPVLRAPDGKAFVQIRDIPPSEVVVLVNHL